MTSSEIPSPPRKRRLRYCFISLAAFAVTVAIFYGEEDWRGHRAMEKCKRELEAQGVNLDWPSRIPPAVPEDENVFGVPEMQKWFVKNSALHTNELIATLKYPGYTNSPRIIVAHVTIVPPGETASNIVPVLHRGESWTDTRPRAEAARLIKEALGPVATDPSGFIMMLRKPAEIRPAQIVLECPNVPATNVLLGFLPHPIVNFMDPGMEDIRLEPIGDGAWNVTMVAPIDAADFLKWSESVEPVLALIRQALQRPYSRINGDYSVPSEMPIPNFVTLRHVSQRLAAMAECHLLLGQPEAALSNVTLINDICRRVPEDARPGTLVSSMINVAIRGLYAGVIADGLKEHAWREPQLAALEGQLEPINLLAALKPGLEMERFSAWHHLATLTPVNYLKMLYVDYTDPRLTNSWKVRENLALWRLIPRGWSDQNMVLAAKLYDNPFASLDTDHKLIFPDKMDASWKQMDEIINHWSPYTFMAWAQMPHYLRASMTTARNQTMINQARVACALERYRLSHGEYPERLDTLVPQVLAAIPHDVIGGLQPHYRRNANGTFLLYSIGWSQKDYGGYVSGDADYFERQRHSDFVWPEQ